MESLSLRTVVFITAFPPVGIEAGVFLFWPNLTKQVKKLIIHFQNYFIIFSMSNSEKTQLVATNHLDVASPPLILHVLDTVKPDILVGESNELLDLKSEVRDSIWNALFDDLRIDEETQRMFYSFANDKEHLLSKAYAHEHGIPYHMIDLPEETSQQEAEMFATKFLVDLFRELPPAKAVEKVREYVRGRFFSNYAAQNEYPEQSGYGGYDIEKQIEHSSSDMVAVRDPHMAKELSGIMDENPDKRILGFFGLIHLVDPYTPKALQLFNDPLHNFRYHLRGKEVKFTKLIDWKK